MNGGITVQSFWFDVSRPYTHNQPADRLLQQADMELETAVRLKLPTVHLVWRDGSFNLVGLLALREYGREVGTHFGPTDFVTLAQSFGATGFRVNDAQELRPVLERALALGSPAVIEIPVDYRENLPLVQPMKLRAVD